MSEQVEGVPDGWRLVRIGSPKAGEWFIDSGNGTPRETSCDWRGSVRVIIEKIEQPKRYRPFANAKEFEPHRDRWWKKKNGDDRTYPPAYYNDKYSGGLHFDNCFEDRVFDDGSPFGVEVTE